MRQSIETAPREGNFILLEDEASGTYGVARWSSEAGRWVGENDEPSRMTPSHWYPMWGVFAVDAPETTAAVGAPTARTQANRRSQLRLGFAISIVTTVAIGALVGAYFLTGYPGLQDNFREFASQELRKSGSFALRPQADVEQARAQVATQDAAQVAQTVETSAPEARQSLKNEQRSAASANEFAALNQEVGAAREAMTASAEQQRRALDEAQARAAALASELAGTRREIETQAAQSQKAVDEAVQQKQTAEATTAELRQSLQREQKKSAALMQETKAAQAMTAQAAQSQKAVDEAVQQKQTAERAVADLQQLLQQEQKKAAALTQEVGVARQAMTASAEQQRRALDEAQARAAALASELAGTRREIETQAAQLHKAVKAAQQKQTAEGAIADLQQLPQQDGDKTEAMARDFASVPRTMDARVAAERSAESVVNVTQVVKTGVTEPLKAAEAQRSAESAKLIARAGVLLGQGNIGAARIVLERAAESGSTQASFMLAETYDPVRLSAWGTYGTRSEAAKAREHYAKAYAGGIREAKDRLDALSQ